MIETVTNPAGVWKRLSHEHQQLDQLFEQLSSALRADAREDAMRLWGQFDERLCTHMELEERILFPGLRNAEPREAAALVEEHAQIRAKLSELGVALDLHQVRAEAFADFVEQLRRHAGRENALAYQWAERHLDAEDQNALEHRPGAAPSAQHPLCDLKRVVRSERAPAR